VYIRAIHELNAEWQNWAIM